VRQKGFTPILIVFLVALLAVGIYFAATKNVFKLLKPSDSTTTSGPAAILNWKMYENLEYRIRFQYPAELSVEELPNLGPNYMQINILDESKKAQSIFMIKTQFDQAERASFVGFSPQGNKKMNGLTWDFYDFPQGYSNSSPFTVYQEVKADILYSFKFYNVITDTLRDKIMGTIEILPPPQQ
jgi:hypothetical protein